MGKAPYSRSEPYTPRGPDFERFSSKDLSTDEGKSTKRPISMTLLLYSRNLFTAVVPLVMAVLVSLRFAAADPFPTRLTGIDSLVIYDGGKRPVRRITNLPRLAQCGAESQESLLLYPLGTSVVQFHDPLGRNTKNFALGTQAVRVSNTEEGLLVVSDTGSVLQISREGTPLRGVDSRDVVWAVKNGATGVATARRSGDLGLYDWGSREPRVTYGAQQAGRPVSFKAIAALSSSRLVAFDAQARELVWFDSELREQSRAPIKLNDPTIFLSLPDTDTLLVSGLGVAAITFIDSGGGREDINTPLLPACADVIPGGGFVIGYSGKGDVTLIEPPFDDVEGRMARLTYDCLFAIVVYAAVGAWGFAKLWISLITWSRRRRDSDPYTPAHELSTETGIPRRGAWFAIAGVVILAYFSLGGAWAVYPTLVGSPSVLNMELSVGQGWGLFTLCCLVLGLSLLWLGRSLGFPVGPVSLSRVSHDFSGKNKIYWFLVLLSLLLAAVCNYRNVVELEPHYPNRSPKIIVACWIASQVFIVMSVARVGAGRILARWTMSEIWSVVAICGVTLLSRLLWLDRYPHNIHHDFGVMGEHVLRYLLEPWFPLFTLDAGQSSGRPWYMQMAGLMWLFGVNDFTLRLSNIIWSVGFVLAAYLIGRETISHRFGLIFGALVAAQHNLLGYSRCPYVMESVAPFMFCLYFLCRGIRATCARDFVVAGIWGAWSLMTIRNFTPYPFIGALIVLLLCVSRPRQMWSLRWHMTLMIVAGAVVFGPYAHFYLYEQHLTARLVDSSPLLSEGRFSSDLGLWLHQFKRAFGGFIVYPDRISWEMEALAPVCVALTSGLFGAGLVILVSRFRSVGAVMALSVIVVDTTLGSALLEAPPSYYHVFVAIIFVMYVVAIPIECLWRLALGVRIRAIRSALTICAVCVTFAAVVEEVWPFVRYSTPTHTRHGVPQPKYNAHSLMARYTLQHRERRFFAVSRPGNTYEFFNATIRLFYGAFSERFELFSDVDDYLPIRPGEIARDTSFFIDNFDDLNKVRAAYPRGMLESFTYAYGEGSIMVYTVPGAEIERVWAQESVQPSARLLRRFEVGES